MLSILPPRPGATNRAVSAGIGNTGGSDAGRFGEYAARAAASWLLDDFDENCIINHSRAHHGGSGCRQSCRRERAYLNIGMVFAVKFQMVPALPVLRAVAGHTRWLKQSLTTI